MKTSNKSVIIVKEKNLKPNPTDVTEDKCTYDPNRPYSNGLRLFFIILQLALSYDLGFMDCKSSKRFAGKIMSITTASVATIVVGLYFIIHFDVFKYHIWLFSLCAQYVFVVVRLFLNRRSNSFCSFLKKLSAIDHKMNTRIKYSDFTIIGLCMLVVICKILVAAVRCKYVPNACIDHFFYINTVMIYVISPSLDIFLVLYCLSFHFVLCRLKNLKNIIIDSNEPISGYVFYKSLVEIIDSCRSCFDVLYVCYLLFKIPDALIAIFLTIKYTKFNAERTCSSMVVYFNWVLQYLTIVIVPAVTASRLAREVDKIKLALHDNLLLENGASSKAKAIRHFLLYIEARPMSFYIYGVIPLDTSFPFIVLNLFITYLIVAVQLSHIY